MAIIKWPVICEYRPQFVFHITVWLTGDMTNHNAESAILSDKQTRQEI